MPIRMHYSIPESLQVEFNANMNNNGLLGEYEDILFLFSGGKDATFCLLLLREYLLSLNRSFKLSALMVTFPQHVYYGDSNIPHGYFVEVKNFWRNIGVNLVIKESIRGDVDENTYAACSHCKAVRKQVINQFLNEVNCNNPTLLVTGYTLMDALSYLDEMLLATDFTLDIDSVSDDKLRNRFYNCLHKMQMFESLPNGNRIIRPLISFDEKRVKTFLDESGIPYVSGICKAAIHKHKRLYSKVLDSVSMNTNVTYEGIINLLRKSSVCFPKTFNDIDSDQFFIDC
jgi:tRNA(Ile)-lysidine synthase TilS/MesJ